jgi:D-alanyl-lipoteichoic acid acyltransferase DltB (MBOAT superfamily)
MLLQSIEFIYIFFPITIVGFLFFNNRYPKIAVSFLITASLIFCGFSEFKDVIILIISIVINYLTALLIQNSKIRLHTKFLLFSGIAFNITLLFWYKFISATVQNSILRGNNSILEFGIPIGLSFFTLYQISFLIDIYKKKANLSDFLSYSASVSMFAHLPAGPVLNYKHSIQQFIDLGRKSISTVTISAGIGLLTFGIFKKIVLADPLSIFTDQMFLAINGKIELTLLEFLLSIWSFLLQIYYDFSAYSDMAIGLGMCFGLSFPVNFNSPLKAKSFVEYISRWHISLITFNRDYIYLPVTRLVRKSLKIGSDKFIFFVSTSIATFVVYIAITFWHSPTIQFLISGTLIGLILILSQSLDFWLIQQNGLNIIKLKSSKIISLVKQIYVLLIASFAASLLRINDFKSLVSHISGFDFSRSLNINWNPIEIFTNFISSKGTDLFFPMIQKPISFFGFGSLSVPFIPFILLCSILALRGQNTMEIFGLIPQKNTRRTNFSIIWKPTMLWGIAIGILLVTYLLVGLDNQTSQKFIYGEF